MTRTKTNKTRTTAGSSGARVASASEIVAGPAKNPKKSKMSSDWWRIAKILMVMIALGALVFIFATMTGRIIAQKQLEGKCAAISNSTDLAVPCQCVPTIKKVNATDIIENQTENFCTCRCWLNENDTFVVEVRVSK